MANDRDTLAEVIDQHVTLPTRYAPEIADRVIAAGWRPPAPKITDPAEMDALPVGTVGIAPSGVAWTRWRDRWTANGSTCSSTYLAKHRGPITVLYDPTEEADRA